jgi:intracellular septation protein
MRNPGPFGYHTRPTFTVWARVQALYDFFPVLAFFVTFKFADIYTATGVLIVVTLVVAAMQWFRTRKISTMLLISTGLALVFGGLTLWLHNELFIMWKPTVVYLLFAAALIVSELTGPKPLVQRLLEERLRADARTWRITNLTWAAFFLLLAAVNLVFVYRFSRDAWVTWKLATVGVVFVFALAQGAWLATRSEAVEAAEPVAPVKR